MKPSYQTALYDRLFAELANVRIIDSHEHLQRETELPTAEQVSIGRFFIHYANCDLRSAGLPAADLAQVMDDRNGLSPEARWDLLAPWYARAWNTGYCESLRIALQDLFGIEDFAPDTVGPLTEAMRQQIKPGWTRQVFDRAGIDYAMVNPFGPKVCWNPDYDPDCFMVDLCDNFSSLELVSIREQTTKEISCLDDYLNLIDGYFAEAGHIASAFKVGRAYDRPLTFRDVTKGDAERIFNRLLGWNNCPDRAEIRAAEDFLIHYLCRKCGEYRLRMKFHTGLQEGNGNLIRNSRAALMSELFFKYPQTDFDIYHISYPYEEELATIAKNFPNVTIDFCWMWIINPAAGRRALSDMLDTVPANKIHGFGGDYIMCEGTYGHAVIARREITRVLCEKVEEGRFSEAYAVEIGTRLLRTNALENFDLETRRPRFRLSRSS